MIKVYYWENSMEESINAKATWEIKIKINNQTEHILNLWTNRQVDVQINFIYKTLATSFY